MASASFFDLRVASVEGGDLCFELCFMLIAVPKVDVVLRTRLGLAEFFLE